MAEFGQPEREPGLLDVVVVRAAIAPTEREWTPEMGWSVVEWGTFRLLDRSVPHVTIEQARVTARLLAKERARRAWDATQQQPVRLPFVPLISCDQSGSYAMSIDETDYTEPVASTCWRGVANLSSAQARELLKHLGFCGASGAALMAAADGPNQLRSQGLKASGAHGAEV